MAENKFHLRDLWPVGVLWAAVASQIAFFPQNAVVVLSLLAFAYVQNIAFGLTSRSRNRSSSTYHFIAAMLSTLIFFWMLERLFTSRLTIFLFFPYVAGTVAGSITGAQISAWIEKKIGAVADIASGTTLTKRSILERGWPVILLAAVLFVQLSTLFFGQVSALGFSGVWALMAPLIALAGLLFTDNFSHTLLSRAGNRNKPGFILATGLFKGVVGFLIYQQLAHARWGWPLWVPYASGSVSGSISGALVSMRIEKKIGASADAHVKGGEKPRVVVWPVVWLLAGAVVWIVGFSEHAVPLMTLLALSLIQNFSFMVVSRARNRNNILYHATASVFSNGIWFLTLRQLVLANLAWPFLIPFAIGTTAGSLIAFNVSTWIERRIGALADAPVKKVPSPA